MPKGIPPLTNTQTTSISYNKVGKILTRTSPIAGHTTSYGYDKLNRKTSTTDALNQTQTITYNILGNVSSTTDELGRTTSYEYDKVDRLTVTTDPLLHTTSTSYDTEGNVLTTTDALGQKTTYLYDKNNRRIQVTDAKGGTTKTGYDGVGNVATITDSVNNTTTYGYDAVDRLITDTNQLNKTRTRSYDNVGNLTQTTDRNGRKVAYNYDTLNRQTSERWLDSNSATIKTFSASYDAVSHLVSSTNPDSSYAYTYDGVDRVTSIDNTGTVGVPAVKFNYGYDAVGNLLSVNDSINGVSAGITGYSYDLLNRVTKLTQAGTGVQTKRVYMAYNAVNQLTSLSRFSGVNGVVDTSYVYDNNQRLIKLAHVKGTSTVASYDYSYDNADKLASTISSVDGTSNYSYDPTNQLTGASHTAQANEAYAYDANGNRTSGGTVTGINNQLLSDGTYSYTYDGEGNRTKRTEIATGKVTEYVWDYRNRLAGVLFKDAGGSVTKTIDYIYDGNNQRIGKRIDGAVVERYVIDRNQIALVFDGAGNQTHRYLYGTAVDQVLADETATSMVWALADNQGTVKDLIDNSGVVVNHVTYDSFGKIIAQSNAGVEFRYGYTGREQDSETGLDYYRARYYDAGNGRFISEDPIGFGAGDGNLTRYVGNSPTNFNDPSGEIAFIPILAGVVISYIAGQAFFPQYAQAPTSPCDNHPTPPDQGLKQAGVEIITGAGVSVAPRLLRSGLQNIAPRVVNFRNGDNLVHMSQHADEIIKSGKLGLPGDIFAGPASNARLSGWPLAGKTGLPPSGSYEPVFIPKVAEGNFSKVIPIGPYTGWQRFMGHQYTARGTLDLNTGNFARTGVNWSQVKNYGADVIIDTGITAVGVSVWNNHD
jgi:RHS repeat-associated protein